MESIISDLILGVKILGVAAILAVFVLGVFFFFFRLFGCSSSEYFHHYDMKTEWEERREILSHSLRKACKADNVRRAAILLIRGADPNNTNDWYGQTILESSHSESMKKLLRAFGGKTRAELEAAEKAARAKAAKLSPEEREEKSMKFVNRLLSVKKVFFWTKSA